MTDRLTRKLIIFSRCRLTYLENIRFVQIVLKFGCDFSPKMSTFVHIPNKKSSPERESWVIVFIKFKLVRRQGIEPRTLGLRGQWYSEK